MHRSPLLSFEREILVDWPCAKEFESSFLGSLLSTFLGGLQRFRHQESTYPDAINLKAFCGTNLVTQHPGIDSLGGECIAARYAFAPQLLQLNQFRCLPICECNCCNWGANPSQPAVVVRTGLATN